jgi:hypothetical protein
MHDRTIKREMRRHAERARQTRARFSRTGLLLLCGAVGIVAESTWLPAGRAAGQEVTRPANPVLVELFTSEGCDSCPAADRLVASLVRDQPVGGAEVIALEEHVDYWDRLGWRDPYSDRLFTSRQQEYAQALRAEVYTPQMVVDGAVAFIGNEFSAAREAIGHAAGNGKVPLSIHIDQAVSAGRVRVRLTTNEDPGKGARAWIAVTEDNLVSKVTRGENQGRVLHHSGVVRRIVRVDLEKNGSGVSGEANVSLDPAWQRNHARIVAVIQQRSAGLVRALAVTGL